MLNVDRFESMLSAGLIARNTWRDTAPDGREMLCALAALSPEVAEAADPSPSACPAADCPPWLAELIPWLDDSPSDEAWPGLMRRLGAVARALPGADPEALRRADYACRVIAVREARYHVGAGHPQVLTAVDGVVVLLDRAALGETITENAWAAEAAARAVAAGWTAEAAEAVAWAAVGPAGWTVGSVAKAAAKAVTWVAVWAARAAARAKASRTAASDRMADAMLTVLERAVGLTAPTPCLLPSTS